jgi:DNA-binding MarR family transcriptional regulator
MAMGKEKEEIRLLVNKVVDLFDYSGDYTQAHERDLNQFLLESGYAKARDVGIKLSEYHVIDCIGRNRLPNATFISKEMGMSKGAISKITAKLASKGLIRAEHLQSNRKEIYYALTSKGRDAFEVHEKIHARGNAKLSAMFEKYDPDALRAISRFLDDILAAL